MVYILSVALVISILYIGYIHYSLFLKKLESKNNYTNHPLFQIGEVVDPTEKDYLIIKSSPDAVNSIVKILFYTVGVSMQDFQNFKASNEELRVKQGYVNAYGNIIMTLKSIIAVKKEEPTEELGE